MYQKNENKNRFPILRERLNSIMGDMTTTEFAKKIGLTRQTMGYYLNGDRIPDSLTLAQICEQCNVSANWLLGLSDTKSPDTNVAAVVQYTGLTEDNVNFLHNPSAFGRNEPLNMYRKALFTLVNDLLKMCQLTNVNIPFFQIQRLVASFEGKTAQAGEGVDKLIAEGAARQRGYAVLPVNDSVSFYASQLAKAIEQEVLNQYSVSETSEPCGHYEKVEINGKQIGVWRE